MLKNHKTDERSVKIVARNSRDIALYAFSKNWRILLSSYTRGVQKQEGFTGSLFQQKTKAKPITGTSDAENYLEVCRKYVLSNPVSAGLVEHPSEWMYSSFHDVHGLLAVETGPTTISRRTSLNSN